MNVQDSHDVNYRTRVCSLISEHQITCYLRAASSPTAVTAVFPHLAYTNIVWFPDLL